MGRRRRDGAPQRPAALRARRLTVAAVALAAALLTSLLIAVVAARNRVFAAVSKGGPLTGIQVFPDTPDFGQLDSDTAKLGDPRPIDDAALHRIARTPPR